MRIDQVSIFYENSDVQNNIYVLSYLFGMIMSGYESPFCNLSQYMTYVEVILCGLLHGCVRSKQQC
jgi:hypothetical protein